MTLREYRQSLGITMQKASEFTGVSLRTYKRYEQDETYGDVIKRDALMKVLNEHFEITEDRGLLSLQTISNISCEIFSKYGSEIQFCYLFGSYAKGYAKENSDVDLCISTNLTGLRYVGLLEELRQALKKKVDLIRLSDLNDNLDLVNEIMKDGIKIYR